MTPNLKQAFERLERAAPEVQEEMALLIKGAIAANGRDAYQDYVDAELAKGLADLAANRATPLREVAPQFFERMKERYGPL